MTLVFVHGAGCTSAVFAAQLAAFPGSIAIDLPGRRGHGALLADRIASVDGFADAVRQELVERRVSDAVLCGSSMGGAIALTLAIRREPRLRAVALLGSGARLRVAPALLDGLERDFPATARTLAGYLFAQPSPAIVAEAVSMIEGVGARQTLLDFRACDPYDVGEDLGGIALPLLALTGERDLLTPPKYGQFVADRVPGADARIVPGAGHLAMIERPEETNEALRGFVERLNAGRAPVEPLE